MQLSGTFDVKLGKSFLDRDPTSYMTMRCDFMPASVDRSQPGSIRVNEGNEVVVDMPNVTSTNLDATTTFRGTARSVQKECILIYNKKTHELTLERIAHTVQLKKTREGRKPDTASLPNSEGSQLLPLPDRSGQETNLKSIRPTPPKRKPPNDPEMMSVTSNTTAQQSLEKKTHSRTLSSSSSSSSASSSSSDMDAESSDSDDDDDDSVSESESSSTLSSLSSERKKSAKTKPPSSNTKSDTKAVVNPNLSAHRKLIEHDLKLSDSDSDCCSD
ncbi:unnamed protein product [Trichobilharzia szidati]|nr:unnamed protein product [Trichobilharzia szidati]